MAGTHFSFDNIKQLIELNIGIADRLDENRAERFTILYCNLSDLNVEVVAKSLENTLRTSDAIVNYVNDYFFILPYTDQYGAEMVKGMFEEFFDADISSVIVSYPADGDTAIDLLQEIQNVSSTLLDNDLYCLDQFTQKA